MARGIGRRKFISGSIAILAGVIGAPKAFDSGKAATGQPNKGATIDREYPLRKWNGQVSIPEFSNIVDRPGLQRVTPKNANWRSQFMAQPPRREWYAESLFSASDGSRILGAVLVRSAETQVWANGWLARRGAMSKFFNCGPTAVFGNAERDMTMVTALGVRADLRWMGAGTNFDDGKAGLQLVTHNDTAKSQFMDQYFSGSFPHDTRLNAANQVVPSNTNGKIKFNNNDFIEVGGIHFTHAIVEGVLVEFPYASYIPIINTINNGVWNEADLTAVYPTIPGLENDWSTVGGSKLNMYVSPEGFAAAPLFANHSQALMYMQRNPYERVSAERFFTEGSKVRSWAAESYHDYSVLAPCREVDNWPLAHDFADVGQTPAGNFPGTPTTPPELVYFSDGVPHVAGHEVPVATDIGDLGRGWTKRETYANQLTIDQQPATFLPGSTNTLFGP